MILSLVLLVACGETDVPATAAPAPAAEKPAAEKPAAEKPAAKLIKPTGTEETYSKDEFETLHGGYGSLPKAKASSTLAPQGANKYDVGQLSDDSPFTAWVEGKDDDGVGEAISFAWECGDPGWSSNGSLSILNGYQKDGGSFQDNGRVKELELAIGGTPVATLALDDRMGEQIFDTPAKVGDQVTLTIKSTYAGKKWKDTAISELWVSCGP